MKNKLFAAILLTALSAPATADPEVTLGRPFSNDFLTVDPGSIRVEMLDDRAVVELTLSLRIDPACVRPIDIALRAGRDGGTFTDLTGVQTNSCSGDTSNFDIRLTGDGAAHLFDIGFVDIASAATLVAIPVSLFSSDVPVVTLGPPVSDDFSTVDPGTIVVENLGAGISVDLQVSITVHPFCIRPIDMDLSAPGDGGTFANLTGTLTNDCGGDTDIFDIRLTGDGGTHTFDIQFVDVMAGTTLASIAVRLFPASGPSVTLGPPVSDDFLTVDPGSIIVERLEAGGSVDLQLALTVHPFCIVPIDIELDTTGDGGTFTDNTGVVTNGCGGDTSVWNITLTGDGSAHLYHILFYDENVGTLLASIAVEIYPGSGDTDGDGVSDFSDNCVEVANADQYDSNGDAIGNICDADITGPGDIEDCLVNFSDLVALKAAFFSNPMLPQWNPHADFDNSGTISFTDLQVLKQQFLGPPGPSAAGCN